MAPRMGVITTAIAMTLTLILGVSVTSAVTTGDVNISGWNSNVTTSETFNEVASESSCSLNDGTVGITFKDEGGAEIGNATGNASLDNCETTVSGTVTARIQNEA